MRWVYFLTKTRLGCKILPSFLFLSQFNCATEKFLMYEASDVLIVVQRAFLSLKFIMMIFFYKTRVR